MYHYKGIMEKLKEAGYSSYRIRHEGLFAQGTIQALRTGTPVNIKTLDAICQILQCSIQDIVEITLDSEPDDKPVKPKITVDGWDECGYCGYRLDGKWTGAKYCQHCGKEIDWDV